MLGLHYKIHVLSLGFICSCVGPVIDVRIKANKYSLEKCVTTYLKVSLSSTLRLSVYDSLLVIRPSCTFRDGSLLKNCLVDLASYLRNLPFNEGYLLSVIHLVCLKYNLTYDTELTRLKDSSDIILGFASLFLLVKTYSNCLLSEISQICYSGVLRAISLGPTEGINIFSCKVLFGMQPLIVPVGRVILGRILNVIGSSIDPYIQVTLSSQFSRYHLVCESHYVACQKATPL